MPPKTRAGLLLDDEARDALVGAGRERNDAGALAVRDPHLRAGDDVLVAVADRAAGDVAGVAAGVGLREREAPAQLARRETGQPALLLLAGAVAHDDARRDRVRVHDPGQRHPPGRELLDDRDVGEEVETEAAERLGDRDPEQAHRLHLLDDLGRDTRRRARSRSRPGAPPAPPNGGRPPAARLGPRGQSSQSWPRGYENPGPGRRGCKEHAGHPVRWPA